MERSLETQVSQAVDAWLAWLPRWEPATHRGRVAPCRRCFGSPVLSAAGLGADVPHGVQHGLSTRIKTIVDHGVAEYTALNLPMLQAELDHQAARNRARSYRPSEGLDPEFEGLPLDPDPVPGSPFLFTISGLADDADAAPRSPPVERRGEGRAPARSRARRRLREHDRPRGVHRPAASPTAHPGRHHAVRRAADRGDARGAHAIARRSVRPERPATAELAEPARTDRCAHRLTRTVC